MAYDSRTDAPRCQHQHMYCRSAFTAPRYQRESEAIAEGLAEREDELAEAS